jgi:RNA polymerase sigma-70 factor (ECF subfamily)
MSLGEDFPTILLAARTGAEWAWALIYRDLAPSVRGYLRGRGAPEPDDLTGDVFLQVVRDLHTFAGDERDLRTWVFTVAHHRLIDDHRYRTRRPLDPAPDEVLQSEGRPRDPEDEALQSLQAGRVLEVIGRLSPDQQDVLLMRLLGELTVDEVANALGKRPGAVKALQRRGLASLKRELAKEGVTL